MRTRKSISKRFKITKNGKIMRRMIGQDHSRAKKTSNRIRKGRKWILVSKAEARTIKRVIGG
jgi:large subunit ribosomal protein L35